MDTSSTFFPNTKPKIDKKLPIFYRQLLNSWLEISQNPITAETILSQLVWDNIFIKINNLFIRKFINSKLFIKDFFHAGKIIPWELFKSKYNLQNSFYYKWRQLISAIPTQWKQIIANSGISAQTPKIHMLYLTRMIPIEEVTSKMAYGMLIHKIKERSTSEMTIQNKLNDNSIDWPFFYHLAWNTTIDSYSRAFQFKSLHNILFLNERLYKLKYAESPMCSFCKINSETIAHLFSECQYTKQL